MDKNVDKQLQYPVDPRFEDTEFLIEADDFAQHALWREWHDKVIWEQDSSGLLYSVGELGGYPVTVSINWAKLNGHRVCFYSDSSRVVDWTMIEEWLNKVCYPRWGNNSRHARTNATNFHHCIHHVANKITGA